MALCDASEKRMSHFKRSCPLKGPMAWNLYLIIDFNIRSTSLTIIPPVAWNVIPCLWEYESSEASIWKLPLMLQWGEMLPPPLIFPPKARWSAHEKISWDMTALPWAQTIPSQTSPSTPLPLLESSLCDWTAVAVILHEGQIWGRNLRQVLGDH